MTTRALLDDYVKPEALYAKASNSEELEDDKNRSLNKSSAKENDKDKETEAAISYFLLYRYAQTKEWIFVFIGTVAALANGAGFPLLFVFFGDLISRFTNFGILAACQFSFLLCQDRGVVPDNFTEELWNASVPSLFNQFENDGLEVVYQLLYVSAGVLVSSTLQVACWSALATNLSKIIRIQYFRAILRQDISFHDVTSAGELNSRMADDVSKIEDGIGDKVSICIQTISTIVGCLIVAFLHSWKVTLVNLAVAPFLGLVSGLFIQVDKSYSIKERSAYAAASKIAQEAISSIRTVTAFACQSKEINRYGDNLSDAKKVGILKGALKGSTLGLIRFMVFGLYGISFWYGTTLVLMDSELQSGDFITSFFAIVYMSFSLGTFGSNLGYLNEAKVIGGKVYEIIDHVPDIDVFSEEGDKPQDLTHRVEFKDVSFYYPTRESVQVLNRATFNVEPGKTTALVGQSGSGKSTIVQLVERFYDPQSGSVLIGGHDIRSLNVHWLRKQIGLVSQEPVLFATTIRENIRWGQTEATEEEIEEAAKKANAYDFIMQFPEKFDTQVGEKGSQMSGGQKQRIAIARAIVTDPKILLLDEATSALDTESETIVQAALEKASAGRTTIVIAHRLSTIRNADKIIGLHHGEVVEQATHDELLAQPSGIYKSLVEAQAAKDSNEMKETDIIDDDDDREISPPRRRGTSKRRSKKSSFFRRSKFSRSSRKKSDFSKEGLNQNEDYEMKVIDGKDSDSVDEENEFPDVSFWTILSYNKPEWCYIAIGCLFSIVSGAADPLLGLVFGDVLVIFTLTSEEEQLERARFYGLMFFALGVAVFFGYAMEACFFAKSGMELTIRLRKAAFKAILRQDIAYFDDPRHSTGALINNLSTDALRVQGSTGIRMGAVVRTITSLGVAIAIAFVFSWKLTLLMLALVPLFVLAGIIQSATLYGKADTVKDIAEPKAQISSEAINNIRTIAALAKEEEVLQIYEQSLEIPTRRSRRKGLLAALAYGYSQITVFILFASTFRLALYLVENDGLSFENVFKVLMAIVYGAAAVGQSSSFVPDYNEAKLSANRIIAMINTVPDIDSYSDQGLKPAHCKGEVALKAVKFRYPARPEHAVFRGMHLIAKSGQTLALVGQSGSGKSTTVQLIERFYDVDRGDLLVDNENIKNLNVNWLRQQIGLVSQEPTLFDLSIKENILLGDNSRQPSEDEVISAAKKANIHDFIQSLPQKYDTNVGGSGSQLSGGQKQRVAIARALIRNPKILLLDEATSALDTESEKIVQEALDGAREGRTCIVIAHRLSTVKNADQIAVVKDGYVAEVGTHKELLAMQGAYYKLVNAQLPSANNSGK